MKESVVIKEERRISAMALFWVVTIATVGLGITVTYCSGILNGLGQLKTVPMYLPNWLVIAYPPVLFFEMGLGLFFALRENIYTHNGRMVRNWMWAFWIMLFISSCVTPYLIFNGMEVASYSLATVSTAFALGTAILTYRQSIAGGVMITVVLAMSALLMIYLGYWAFA